MGVVYILGEGRKGFFGQTRQLMTEQCNVTRTMGQPETRARPPGPEPGVGLESKSGARELTLETVSLR